MNTQSVLQKREPGKQTTQKQDGSTTTRSLKETVVSQRDPYLALKKYLSHRPEGIDEFYLQPIDNPKEDIWYKKLPLKRDGLANKGNFTNSSGRKTAIQNSSRSFRSTGNLGAHWARQPYLHPVLQAQLRTNTEGNG